MDATIDRGHRTGITIGQEKQRTEKNGGKQSTVYDNIKERVYT